MAVSGPPAKSKFLAVTYRIVLEPKESAADGAFTVLGRGAVLGAFELALEIRHGIEATARYYSSVFKSSRKIT